ncbi:MAG: hypothetical protein ACOCUH_02935 [Bacteriovoracia bacterium]
MYKTLWFIFIFLISSKLHTQVANLPSSYSSFKTKFIKLENDPEYQAFVSKLNKHKEGLFELQKKQQENVQRNLAILKKQIKEESSMIKIYAAYEQMIENPNQLDYDLLQMEKIAFNHYSQLKLAANKYNKALNSKNTEEIDKAALRLKELNHTVDTDASEKIHIPNMTFNLSAMQQYSVAASYLDDCVNNLPSVNNILEKPLENEHQKFLDEITALVDRASEYGDTVLDVCEEVKSMAQRYEDKVLKTAHNSIKIMKKELNSATKELKQNNKHDTSKREVDIYTKQDFQKNNVKLIEGQTFVLSPDSYEEDNLATPKAVKELGQQIVPALTMLVHLPSDMKPQEAPTGVTHYADLMYVINEIDKATIQTNELEECALTVDEFDPIPKQLLNLKVGECQECDFEKDTPAQLFFAENKINPKKVEKYLLEDDNRWLYVFKGENKANKEKNEVWVLASIDKNSKEIGFKTYNITQDAQKAELLKPKNSTPLNKRLLMVNLLNTDYWDDPGTQLAIGFNTRIDRQEVQILELNNKKFNIKGDVLLDEQRANFSTEWKGLKDDRGQDHMKIYQKTRVYYDGKWDHMSGMVYASKTCNFNLNYNRNKSGTQKLTTSSSVGIKKHTFSANAGVTKPHNENSLDWLLSLGYRYQAVSTKTGSALYIKLDQKVVNPAPNSPWGSFGLIFVPQYGRRFQGH